jgi:putative sterol carrier protein
MMPADNLAAMSEQHVFLSDGWIEAAKAAYEAHGVTVPYKIRMNQVITDCPFEPSEVRMYMDTSEGTMVTGKGELEGAEVTLTTDWETSRKIIVEQDQAAAMQAFMSGKIKVTGDMTKIMMMNANPPTEAQKAAAAAIKAMTA